MNNYLVTLAMAAFLAFGCGSSKSDNPMSVDGKWDVQDEEDLQTVNQDTTDLVEDVTVATKDTVEEPDIPVITDTGPPDYLPGLLQLHWSNLGHKDMVTVRKKILLEFDPDTRFPQNSEEAKWYDKVFEVHVTTWDDKAGVAGTEIPMDINWRKTKEGLYRRPGLVLQPERCDLTSNECVEGAGDGQWVPTQGYRVTIWLGDQLFERIFHTLPAWSAGYKVVDFTIPAEECERCFPYPVHVNVFVPPEYDSPDPELNNTSMPWDNSKQRYSVLVGLHTYNAHGMKLADTFGWATLPRFSSQGVLEPILLVLPDGTVPSQYCSSPWKWPVNANPTCYTQFMGIPNPDLIPDFTAYSNYSYFMANTMRRGVAQKFRIRGMDDEGNKLDNVGNPIDENFPDDNAGRDFYRRAWGVTGCSGGGFGTPINTFLFPQDWGVMFALIGASPSMFNPYVYFGHQGITQNQVCNKKNNGNYPYEPVGDGYRDLSMIDPATMTACPEGQLCSWPKGYCMPAEDCTGTCNSEPCWSTGRVRDITADQRHIPEGGKSCFMSAPPAVSNGIVLSLLCGLDTTCRASGDSPDMWRAKFELYPFDGNLMFTTGTRDHEGPPSGFMDLDQQLDKQGVVHSFRYEDRGAVYHDWNAVHDYVEGYPTIERQDGSVVPGNFPNTGLLYPYVNNAFEGLGNHPFNHPFSSEFTTGAMDPDRDYSIDLVYEGQPELSYVEDNCPGIPNKDQLDSDGDGVGDACDDD